MSVAEISSSFENTSTLEITLPEAKVGSEDHVSSTAIDKMHKGEVHCGNPECKLKGTELVSKRCSRCKIVRYCSINCQRMHWTVHKKECEKHLVDTRGDYKNEALMKLNQIDEHYDKRIIGIHS